MSNDQIQDYEHGVQGDGDGLTRRLAIAVLTKPVDCFLNTVRDHRDFAIACAALHRVLGPYMKRLEDLTELMKTVQARLMVGLAQRDDMSSIMASVQRPGVLS